MSKLSKTIKAYSLKNGEKRYMFQIRTGNHSTTRRRGFLSQAEAEIAYSNLRNDIIKGNFNKKAGLVTYKQIYDNWLKRYKNTVKATTYSKTKDEFKLHILPFFGDTVIVGLSVGKCQEALNNWVENLVHYKKICNYANIIFKEAIRLEYIYKNPMDQLIIPKSSLHRDEQKEKKNKINFYSLEEQEAFLKEARSWSFKKYVFFRLIAYTGMRREEILPLQWKDIDFENEYVLVNKALVYTKDKGQFIQSTKNDDVRNLIIDDETIQVLAEWKKQQHQKITVTDPGKQLIFNNQFNDYFSLSTPRKWQLTINTRIGLTHNVTLHGFRHTHGTLLLDNNPNLTPKDLQKRLGHRDLATTMNIYLHSTNKSDQKILNALNNLDKKEAQKDIESNG